jgi:hypothetical protein
VLVDERTQDLGRHVVEVDLHKICAALFHLPDGFASLGGSLDPERPGPSGRFLIDLAASRENSWTVRIPARISSRQWTTSSARSPPISRMPTIPLGRKRSSSAAFSSTRRTVDFSGRRAGVHACPTTPA